MKHTAPANENTCNMKHLLQHTSEISETFETYGCNMCIAAATYATKHLQHTPFVPKKESFLLPKSQ